MMILLYWCTVRTLQYAKEQWCYTLYHSTVHTQCSGYIRRVYCTQYKAKYKKYSAVFNFKNGGFVF